MHSGPFAFSPGAVVCVDGKELLVYAAADESPLWKKSLAAPIAAVAFAGDDVLALDARGTLLRLAADSGAELARETFVGEPRALAARGDTLAVALEDAVRVAAGAAGARATLAIEGAQALAFSAKLLAVGTGAGKLHVVESETTLAVASLDAPIRGVVRHPAGFWLATAKDTVYRVKDDGEATPLFRAVGGDASALACSKDGSLVAVQTDAKKVAVLVYPSGETLLTATYPERAPVGVALTADGRFLWIGLEKGDANKIDLDEQDIYRTDPHPGRARAAWTLRLQLDKAVRARAKAPPPAPAKKPAARSPWPSAQAGASATSDGKAATATATAAVAIAAEPDALAGPREPELPPSPAADKRVVLAVLVGASVAAALSLFLGR